MTTKPAPPPTHFTEHAEYTGVRADDREAWLALRRTMITASDFAALLGEDPHKTALDVYADKVMDQREPEVLGIDDPRFWGQELEQTVLRAAARHYGWAYQRGGFLLRSRRHPFIGATLDAEIDRHDGFGWIPFECKNTELHRNWDEQTQGCPIHVAIQCQVQLLVSGAPVDLCFALLSRYRPVRIHVDANADFHAVLVEVGEEFMERLRTLDPPPPSADSGDALQRLFPHEDGSIVPLPPEAVEWTRELQHVARELETLEGRRDELRNMIKLAIGPASFGVLPEEVGGKQCWRWLTQKREGYIVAPTESRTLLAMKDAKLPGQKRARPKLPPKQPTLDLEQALEQSQLVAARSRR